VVRDLTLAALRQNGNPKRPYTMEMRIGEFILDTALRYTNMSIPAGERIIFTKDEINIKAILATQFQDFGKGQKFNRDWHEFLGDSIFATDGDKWHNSRQLIRPQFIKDRLSDIKIFEKHSQALLPLLKGPVVDVRDLFFRFTMDASVEFLLGRSVDSLSNGKIAFADAFNYVQHIYSIIGRVGDFNWAVPRTKVRKDLEIVNNFVEIFIEDALSLSPEELEKRTKSDEGYTFLHALASQNRDRKFLRDQIVAVLLAGRDTTACTLSWLFYEISTLPGVQEKLRAEVLRTVGTAKEPTYEDLKGMKYLQVSFAVFAKSFADDTGSTA
jgi:cytochrome P450